MGFSFHLPYIALSLDITGFKRCCFWLWLSAFDAHRHVSVYVLLQFQYREWVLFFCRSLNLEWLGAFLNFCISECKPFAAVAFSIFSLQWLFPPLPALWCHWQWLFGRSYNRFFQKVVFELFLFIITRSIIVLNISVPRGGIWLDVI